MAGQGVGLVNKIQSLKEIFDKMTTKVEVALAEIQGNIDKHAAGWTVKYLGTPLQSAD